MTDEDCVNCTEECRVLGHSDRCWMPQFPAGGGPQAEGGDYRTNVFVPAGVEAAPEADAAYETLVNPGGKKTFCTFGKERRDHNTILVANVKPYLKAKRALSPLLQETSSSPGSPAKGSSSSSSTAAASPSCAVVKSPADGAEGTPAPPPCSSGLHYGPPPDGQNNLSPAKPAAARDQGAYHHPPPSCGDPVAKVLAEARSRISQQGADQPERGRGDPSADPEPTARDIDQLLQDCRGDAISLSSQTISLRPGSGDGKKQFTLRPPPLTGWLAGWLAWALCAAASGAVRREALDILLADSSNT
ncbi:unnamed protein product [Boreogadus saida]